MQLAESVGLIGPASRVGDLHAAIQRFHDLICVNATIKAAVMAADVISGAATSVRDYPPLPMQFACSGVFPVYSADQMRAYVDADRAGRAPADSVTAPAGGVVDGPALAPSAFVNAAGIKADDKPGTVVRKLDAAFHDAVTFADAAQQGDARLWCVHVQGPDDVIAMPSKSAALEHANDLNALFGRHPYEEGDPIMRAVVIEWPHSADSHAADLVIQDATHGAAPTPPAQAADSVPSRFGSPELQAMILARCVEKDRADSVLEDAARLDWLDHQRESYGFQDIHEGNRWEISGAYANVREAIDAERAARKQGGAT